MHQLLIVGNGFDLTCGLKSSFVDFYKERERLGRQWSAGDESTIWDIILYDSYRESRSRWCDIEGEIARWVYGADSEPAAISKCVANWHEVIGDRPTNATYNYQDLEYPDIYSYACSKIGYQIDCGSFASLLKNELLSFEKCFSAYLTAQVQQNGDYIAQAVKWGNALLCDGGVSSGWSNDSSILNFNYTNPWIEFCGKEAVDVRCIHGSLAENNVIFGMDAHKAMEDDVARPFTKAYRILENGVQGSSDARRLAWRYDPYEENTRTGIIKIFGHSLAVADYSYFQSIFDTVDLYGSDTRLIVYYRVYDQKKGRKKIREETCLAVSRLLFAYGQTLDNIDHGRNLMTRLMLEGRLVVKELVA